MTATYGQTLSAVSITGGTSTPTGAFTWTTPGNSVGNVGTPSHNMTFTPSDTANYNTVTQNVAITVSKANPTVTWPTGLTATYGQTLTDVSLTSHTNGGTGTFAWTTPGNSVGSAGSQSHNMTFTPNDTANYNTAANSVTITVGKAIGATVSAPTQKTVAYNSIEVNAVTASTGQDVEYAIVQSSSEPSAPSTGWQDSAVFGSLTAETDYYVFARAKENTNYNAGTAAVSAKITTPQQNPLGSENNPFLVTNETDLRKVGTGEAHTGGDWTLSAHYKQTASFTMTGGNFTAIGNYTNQFTGTYDGDGFTITSLTINATTNFQGMFGCIGSDGMVKNVGLVNVSISVTGTSNYVGGVAGYNNGGKVQNCYVTGTVTGSGNYVGGVVGNNNGGTVQNCYVTGAVSGNDQVGGVVGCNNGMVQNCYATGSVTGTSGNVGGVVGNNSGTVSNCYAICSVTNNGAVVGGVVGYNSGGTIQNCYATGSVSGTNSVGGITGWSNGGTVKNCVALNQSVTATNNTTEIGRVVGVGNPTLMGNYAWSGMTVKYNTSTTYTPTAGATLKDGADLSAATAKTQAAWGDTSGSTGANFTFVTTGDGWKWDASNNYMPSLFGEQTAWPGYLVDVTAPDGTAGDPFLVTSEADLRGVGTNTGSYTGWTLAAHYKQTANIIMSSTNFTPIGNYTNQFTGTYDGDGFTITSLTINATTNFQGMFGCIGSDGMVKNVGLVNVSISVTGNSGNVGGVAGYNNGGKVQNCYVTGTVTGSGNYVGGVVGNCVIITINTLHDFRCSQSYPPFHHQPRALNKVS